MMNRIKPANRLRAFAATLATMVILGAYSAALAVPFPPPALSICFGSFGFVSSTGSFVDINGSPGFESIVPQTSVVLKADLDFDLLAAADTTYIVNYNDESGARIWTRTGLGVTSNEIFTAVPGFDLLNVGTTFTTSFNMAGFYTLQTVCQGVGVAEVGGTSYIIVTGGAAAAVGTPEAGTDLSKVRIWVLDKDNQGAIVQTHTIAGAPGLFFQPQGSRIMDIDGDGDDELVVVRAEYRTPLGNKERVRLHTEVFDLLSGDSEGVISSVNYSISFDNQNNP